MIGTFGTSAYKDITALENHRSYLDFMYGGLKKGFITRATIKDGIYRQNHYTSNWLINKNSYYNVLDVFTSMNTFCKPQRTVEQLKRLNALYLDLDCYKLGMTQEQVLAELEDDYFDRLLPVPSFVINSGRGLYLIWKIDEDRNALPRWTSVQQHFFDICKPFNADSQSLDAARILRVPFSKNSNNGASVSIMRFYNVKYTLYEIIKEFNVEPYVESTKCNSSVYPYGEATERQRQCARIIAEKHGLELPDFTNYDDTYNFIATYYERPDSDRKSNIIYFNASNTKPFLLGRCADIARLFSLRRGENCRREYGLFLYRLWLCEATNDFDFALRETLILNESLDCPFPVKYVIERTASAEKKVKNGSTYKYSKNKIIEVLAITDDEMSYMSYLYNNPVTVKERKSASNRRAYLHRLESEGRTTKKESLRQRRANIETMLEQGHDKAFICDSLKISSKTYDRDIIVISFNKTIGLIVDTKDAICEAATGIVDGISKSTQPIVNAVRLMLKGGQTKIQLTNYYRTSIACSAFPFPGFGPNGYVQLSLFCPCGSCDFSYCLDSS